jgi:hypothetical protein
MKPIVSRFHGTGSGQNVAAPIGAAGIAMP